MFPTVMRREEALILLMRGIPSNDDLISAFGSSSVSATQHYVSKGYAGKNIDTFDAWSYLASNDDLISAFGSSSVSATQHYVSKGYAEEEALILLMSGVIWQVMTI